MNIGDDANRLAAEARARVLIDRQLSGAGWSVQDRGSLNLFAWSGTSSMLSTPTGRPKPSTAPRTLTLSVSS